MILFVMPKNHVHYFARQLSLAQVYIHHEYVVISTVILHNDHMHVHGHV